MITETGKDIDKAIHYLKKNELVAIPTETVYGLAGNALEKEAVLKIFETKNRPHFDPLIVHTNSLKKVSNFTVEISESAHKVFEKFSPGPVTVLLPKNHKIPDLVTAGLNTVAVRIPDHELALNLLEKLPFPVAAPSANPFGYISPTNADHVYHQLKNKIPYILDGGPCKTGIESTILEIHEDQIIVHREGGISIEALKQVNNNVILNNDAEKASPGNLKSHYSPGKKFITGNLSELIKKFKNKKIAILSYSEFYDTGLPFCEKNLVLSPNNDIHEAAKNLFHYMRLLDQSNADIILAEWVPDHGIGKAVNNRLKKAAGKWIS